MAQFHSALYVDPNNNVAAESLKNLERHNNKPARDDAKTTMPTQEELDQFLNGKGKTLHGYDAR
jgi:hypothetical protein